MQDPNTPIPTVESQLESTATIANAILLTKLIFMGVSGREISNLEHLDTNVDDLIAANINKQIASK